jgi:hypothetical protein
VRNLVCHVKGRTQIGGAVKRMLRTIFGPEKEKKKELEINT